MSSVLMTNVTSFSKISQIELFFHLCSQIVQHFSGNDQPYNRRNKRSRTRNISPIATFPNRSRRTNALCPARILSF